MQENHLTKLLSARSRILGILCIAFCCVVLTGCGGGGADAACVATLGALGGNACKNGTSNKTTQLTLTLNSETYQVNENTVGFSGTLLNTTSLTGVTFHVNNNAVPNQVNQYYGVGLGGVLSINPSTGAFSYTPPANRFTGDRSNGGADTFVFYVEDNNSQFSGLANVAFTVNEHYDSHVAVSVAAQSGTYDPTQGMTNGFIQISNPNNYPIQLVATNAANGSVSIITPNISSSTGYFTYTQRPGFTQADSFTFEVIDLQHSVTQSATYSLTPIAAGEITWQQNLILGVYNTSLSPKYNQVSVQMQATCTTGNPQYINVVDPSWPSGLNPISPSGLITGSLSSTPGPTPIRINAQCPGNPQTYSQLFQFYVLPQNIVEFTATSAFVLSGASLINQPAGTFFPAIGMGQCPTNTTPTALIDNCVTAFFPLTSLFMPGLSAGQYKLTPTGISSMSVLVVGGGGGGAFGNTVAAGAGGGAGGFLHYDNVPINYVNAQTSQPFTIQVGAPGAGGIFNAAPTPSVAPQAGQPSSFGSIQALGGLPAGNTAGGSGGGEPGTNALSPTNIVTFAGGSVIVGSNEGGGAGANGPGGATGTGVGPQPGLGAPNLITGQLQYYGTGGSGGSLAGICTTNTTLAPDGNGGNGGVIPSGGATSCPGLSGDPGVVIISF